MEREICSRVAAKEGESSVESTRRFGRSGLLSSRQVRTVLGTLAAIAALLMSGALMAQSDSNYRLASDDLLDFRVFQEPELDAVIRVSGDGNAIFPLVGQVPIAGKTIGEATELLRQRYMAGYLVNPQVTLTVRNYARRVFTMLGQISKPGSYSIEGSETISLLDAIGIGRRLHPDRLIRAKSR